MGFNTISNCNEWPIEGLPFTLSEVLSDENGRLFFTTGDPTDDQGEGTIVLPEPDIMVEQNVTVYALVSHIG